MTHKTPRVQLPSCFSAVHLYIEINFSHKPETLKGQCRKRLLAASKPAPKQTLCCLCLCLGAIWIHVANLHQHLWLDMWTAPSDASCVCPLFHRTGCLRHHRSPGSWTLAATTRTCTRPRRRATPAFIIMTTTWCPGPWRPSFITWSQLWTITQTWVLLLSAKVSHFFLFLFVSLCF